MKVVEAIVTLSIGIFIGVVATINSRERTPTINGPRRSKHRDAFLLAITIKFNTVEDKQKFIEIFDPYAKYIATVEPGTISYELSESDKSPLQIFLIERYVNKNAYLEIHRKTETFINFRAKLTDLSATMTMDGHSYIESNVGFM
jgi:quinol monooxygenase YgiN